MLSNLRIYKIGTKISVFTMGALQSISTIVGSTKFPGLLILFPPYKTFPPYFLISSIPSKYSFTYPSECKGPNKVLGFKGSP